MPGILPVRAVLRNVAACFLLAAHLAGPSPTAADEPRHLIYLHGRIVQEEQSARPRHPRYGLYELEAILDAFRARGFAVSGEMRPKGASVTESADRLVAGVRGLLDAGVAAERITVVGGSMGAAIALLAAVRLQNPDLRFALLGACLSESVRALAGAEGAGPRGRLLAIREASDELTEPCRAWSGGSAAGAGLVVRELRLETGLAHGFLYRPLPSWVDPVVEWANAPGGRAAD